MQSVKMSFKECNLVIASNSVKLNQSWHKRLAQECPEQSATTRESIVLWLLGDNLQRLELLEPLELEMVKQAMEYRWKILRQRYLGIDREQAYRKLIIRLGSVIFSRSKLQTWANLSRDRQRSVMDKLQAVIQELLQNDTYLQQQMAGIAELTADRQLQNTLLFASIEEYALRPVGNQPLLVYCFVNYLRKTQQAGFSQISDVE